MDCSSPGSSIHGIFQTRVLEWVAISFSNAWKWTGKVKSLSRVRPSATPWTAAYQAPPYFPGKSTGVGCHCLNCWAQVLQLEKPMCCSEDGKQPNKYLEKKTKQWKNKVIFSLAKVGRCKLGAGSNYGASLMEKANLRKWSWYTEKKREREKKFLGLLALGFCIIRGTSAPTSFPQFS